MRIRLSLFILWISVIFIPGFVNADSITVPKGTMPEHHILSKISGLKIPFIKNQGQADDSIAFYASIHNGKVSVLKSGSITYSIFKKTKDNQFQGVVLEEFFINSQVLTVKGGQNTITKVSYFSGSDRDVHKHNLPSYETVELGEVFKDISVKLKVCGNNIEKIFYLNPGAEVSHIKMGFRGVDQWRISDSGQLDLETTYGIVSLTKPIAYQIKNGRKVPVSVSYTRNDQAYSFHVGEYDRSEILIIDPLIASTFAGGSKEDAVYQPYIVSDQNGHIFISGFTLSTDFPTSIGSFNERFNGGTTDRFVSKFDQDLTTLLASTFIGGSGDEFGMGIDLDEKGHVFISGYTSSSDFPVTTGAYQKTLKGGRDVFIAKLDNNLSTLYAATYLGGSDDEAKYFPRIDMKIGASGGVYVTGLTLSKDFPVSNNAFDKTYNGGIQVGDFFVSKLNNDLSTLMGSTYLGGSDEEWRPSLILDQDENVFICGETWAKDYPTTSDAFDSSSKGAADICISKLSSDLSTLMASTLFGGNGGDEEALTMALGRNQEIYIAGYMSASNFPQTSTLLGHNSLKGPNDGYIAKFSNDLKRLLASTIIGGNRMDFCRGIKVMDNGNIIVTGNTSSIDFPVSLNSFDMTFNGGSDTAGDMFIIKMDGDLTSLLASTYFGGSGDEKGYQLLNDGNGHILVTGQTGSSDFPMRENAFDSSYGGEADCFVIKIDEDLSLDIQDISLDMQIKKIELKGWIIRKEKIEISLEMHNPNDLNVSKIVLYKKSEGQNEWKIVKDIVPSFIKPTAIFYDEEYSSPSLYFSEIIDHSGQAIFRSAPQRI